LLGFTFGRAGAPSRVLSCEEGATTDSADAYLLLCVAVLLFLCHNVLLIDLPLARYREGYTWPAQSMERELGRCHIFDTTPYLGVQHCKLRPKLGIGLTTAMLHLQLCVGNGHRGRSNLTISIRSLLRAAPCCCWPRDQKSLRSIGFPDLRLITNLLQPLRGRIFNDGFGRTTAGQVAGVDGCSGRKSVCSASVLFVAAGQGLVRFAKNMPWMYTCSINDVPTTLDY
jgi:hypothetical protein